MDVPARLVRFGLALLLLLGGLAGPAVACLWDYDTLKMERRQFPDAHELIAGRFLRHGEAFYRWRIQDRTRRLAEDPDDLALYDDLAVAHEKVGETSRAIEVMLAKAQKRDGVYETEANLGTFHVHAGQYAEGLAHIRRAIQINPDAHFGRELYQQLLVEYVLARRAVGATLPLDDTPEPHDERGFARWVLEERSVDGETSKEIAAAVKGVLGMMRFGHHDSPVLLEALGDLLLAGDGRAEGAARRLASRAYLKASLGSQGAAREAYRALARAALSMQTREPGTTATLTLGDVEASLAQEVAAADAFHAAVVAGEERWIRDGEDPERRFDETYYRDASHGPGLDAERSGREAAGSRGGTARLAIVAAVLLLLVAAASWLLARRRA